MKPSFRTAIFVPTVLFAASTARAVIVYTGDTAEPASYYAAPSDYAAGWSYVGSLSNSSGGTLTGSAVYLGDYSGAYWVITAAHVGLGADVASVTLNGSTYAVVSGSMVQLTNGGGSGTDLVMFKIAGDGALAALTNLTISTTSPTAGSTILYVGNSYARGSSARSYWNVDTTGHAGTPADPYVWNAGTSGSHNASGYLVTGGMTKSWGENTVSGTQVITVNGRTVSAFYSTFAGNNGSSVLYAGDSGGATFLDTGDGWVLAGINEAVGTYSGQPGGTAVVGQPSYSTDLSVYATQINGYLYAAVPEPGTYGLIGVGTLGAAAWVRRRKKS